MILCIIHKIYIRTSVSFQLDNGFRNKNKILIWQKSENRKKMGKNECCI
jgi:hypothetical protein